MNELSKKLTGLYIRVGLIGLLMALFIGATAYGIVDKKYTILTVERAYAINVIHAKARLVSGGDQHGKVGNIIRDVDNWKPIALDYDSAEIYPVYPNTGYSVFPSVLTEKRSQDDLKTLNRDSHEPQRMFVLNRRGLPVFRVSGTENFGIQPYTINADIDLLEVVENYWWRFAAILIAFIMVLSIVRQMRQVKGAAANDVLIESSDSVFQTRILSAAFEALEVDVLVAKADENGKSSIIYASGGFHRRMGYQRGELDGLALEVFLPKEKHEKHKSWVGKAVSVGEQIPGRIVHPVKKDGTQTTINLDIKRTNHVWGDYYWVASVRD